MLDTPPRILLVEDDEVIRSALEVALQEAGFEVRALSDGTDIRAACNGFAPDVVILDVRLATGPDGYEVARQLRASASLPILFLSAAGEEQDRLKGFEAGGDDYLVKPFSMRELIARVQALLRRSGRASLSKLIVGDVVIDPVLRTVTRDGSSVPLTDLEFELLWTLARQPGRVWSRIQLLNEVWGSAAYGANLVEVRVSGLRHKLEAHGWPRILHTVRGQGYVFRA